MPVETELYDILEVPVTATQEEIKKAYRKKALQHHPDKGGDQETFKKLNASYEILSNPEKRELYNNSGKTGLRDSGEVPEDILAAMFGNIFQKMGGLGNMFGILQNVHNAIRKTQPTIHHLNVSLEDLCTRKIVKLKVTRERICPCCDDNKAMSCSECNGKGNKILIRRFGPGMFQQMQHPCEKCQGQGKIYESCENCQNGIKQDPKIFEVHLTPEFENGYKYIFNNEGNQIRGYESGDFIVVIVRKEHPKFQVKSQNLIYKKEISLKEALCGVSFDITHPSGEILTVSTHEVISPETVQILPKGMVDGAKMEIHYKIIFPKALTPEQTEIIYKNL